MTEMEVRRRTKGYTQQFIADNIDVSVGCYNMYENNQRRIPKDKAEAIADVLKCKVSDIFTPCSFTSCETIAKQAN